MRSQRLRLSLWLTILLGIGSFFTGCNTELSRARELLQRKDYLFAAIFYEKALKRDPDNEEALKELTKLYCDQLKRVNKCFEKSELLYRRYKNDTQIKTWYKGSLLTVAKGLFQEQRLRKASSYLLKYRAIDPKNFHVVFMLGNARFRLYSKPPFSENDKRNLKEAIKYLKEAIKHSTPDTQAVSAYNSKKKNMLQWEAYMLIGRVYEMYLIEGFKEWRKELAAKQKAAAKKAKEDAKKKKRRRRQRRRKKEKKKEEPKFPYNKAHFAKAKAAYDAAAALKQPNKYKRFLPSFRVGMIYANLLRENENSVKYLHMAEKVDPNNASIIGNLKMIYDRLKEKAENDKKKKLAREYAQKSAQYDSQIASLRALR